MRHPTRKIRWMNWRLPSKLLLFYMPLILLPVIFGMYFVSDRYDQASRQQMQENTQQLLNIAVERLDLQFERFEELSLKFFVDTRIHDLLDNQAQTYYEKVLNHQQLDQEVNKLLAGPERQYLPVSIVISNEGDKYVIGSRTSIDIDKAFSQKMIEANGGAVWEIGSYDGNPILDGRIIMGRSINELEKFSRVGQIVFVIEPEAFLSTWKETVKDGDISFRILTADNTTLLGSDDNSLNTSGRHLTLPVKSKVFDLTLVAHVPLKHLDRVVAETRLFTVAVTAICVLIGLGVTHIFAVDMIVPIRKLMKNMKRGIRGIEPKQLEPVSGAR